MTAPRVRDGVADAWVFPENHAGLRHLPLGSQVSTQAQTRMVTRETSQVPTLHGRHSPRPRLTSLLDSCTAQSILVIAPAGYGKTSLAAEWLSGRDDIAWFRATSGSADVAALSSGLVEAIAPLVPGAGDRLRQRLRVAEPPETAARPLAELLAEDLAHWPDRARLVVDDYHFVAESTPVEDFMDWLLMLAPRLRVLVTTRKRPRWATARRILYGEVAEITKEQLAMTDDEAAEVLAGRPTEAVRALIAQAQGWPALIGLAALATTEDIPTERVSDELFRYFAEEVLRQQPEDVQRFMLRAALPKTLTARLAEEGLGLENAEASIEALAAEGFLLEAAPYGWSFHPLLQDFLRHRLETEHPKLAAELTDRVIEHARTAGDWEEAFELAASSDRVETTAEILGDAASTLLSDGQIEIVEKWLDDCAATVFHHPGALLARAEVALRRGRLSEASGLGLSVGSDGQATDSVKSRACCLAGKAAHLLSRDQEALELSRRALALSSSDEEAAESLWTGFLAASDLEIEDARGLAAEYRLRAPRGVDAQVRHVDALLLQGIRDGSLSGAVSCAEPMLPMVEYVTDPLVQTSFLTLFSYVQSVRAEYDDAHQIASIAYRKAREMRLDWIGHSCLGTQAYAELGLRRFRQAKRTAQELARVAGSLGDVFLAATSRLILLRAALGQCKPLSVSDLHMPSAELRQLPAFARGELLALKALALAASGDLDDAERHADEANQHTRSIETTFISRLARLAADYQRSNGHPHNAQAVLDEVVTAEAFDLFVLAYRSFPPLLRLARETSGPASALGDAVLRAGDSALASHCGFEVRGADSDHRLQSLTPREADVLSLVEQGLSNAEIAQKLFVEVSTIKSHVHSILRKLDVNNRLQLMLIAREQ